MIGLTPKQHECLQFIRSYVTMNGYSPSYDEIMAGIGLKSKSGIARLINGLVDRGHITTARYKARSIALKEAA